MRNKSVEDVISERRRQLTVEGWSEVHDDQYHQSELARAGAAYALAGTPFEVTLDGGERLWPWNNVWWKPTTRRRNLIKAAALLLAEIDRLDRLDTNVPA